MDLENQERNGNEYLSTEVNPVFHKLIKDILKEKPFDIVSFFLQWLKKFHK